jgi:O-antigen/teichoic acid export membrane protein
MSQRGLLANASLALLADLATKVAALAVAVIAARALGPRGFAVVAATLAWVSVATATVDMGSQALLTRDGTAGAAIRGALLRRLWRERALPVAALGVLIVVAGALTGHAVTVAAAVVMTVGGAASLTLIGALRSGQDLRPEATGRLIQSLLSCAGAGAAACLGADAGGMLAALAVATVLGLTPVWRAARRSVDMSATDASSAGALRRAAPLGAVALATLAYYRSGTIAMSLLASKTETSRYAIASTIAFGLLALTNAVSTSLLPRLSATHDPHEFGAVVRRALRASACVGLAAALAASAFARFGITIVFGARYGSAAGPLALLAAATVIIGPAGVLGTALIARRRLRPLAHQIAATLAVNLLALAVLVPPFGAAGAAWATILCEGVGAILLVRACRRDLPGVLTIGSGRGLLGSVRGTA